MGWIRAVRLLLNFSYLQNARELTDKFSDDVTGKYISAE